MENGSNTNKMEETGVKLKEQMENKGGGSGRYREKKRNRENGKEDAGKRIKHEENWEKQG